MISKGRALAQNERDRRASIKWYMVPTETEAAEAREQEAITALKVFKDRGPLAKLLRQGKLSRKGLALAADLLEGKLKIGVGRPPQKNPSPI